jgi:tetratricopeptide (TPR) repeat protein
MSDMEGGTAMRVPRNAGLALVIVVALVLVWRVVVSGSVALLAGTTSADPNRTKAPLDVAAPDAHWRARLAQNPTDYAALVVLALQYEQQGRLAEAGAAMREALRLAPADEGTLLEASALYLRTGEEPNALIVLRRAVELNPTAGNAAWPIFAAALNSGRHDPFFAGAARDNPGWWPAFFDYACQSATEIDAVQRIFGVRAAAGTATTAERKCVIERLQHENRWAIAYQSWINSLPRDQQRRIGYIFNGEFEFPISNVGFDWVIVPQDGVNVETQSIQGARGRRALRIEFVRKRWVRTPVQQHLTLYPGKFRFEGRGRADGLDTWMGVQWGLYCLQADGGPGRQLAHSDRFRGTSEWVEFHDDFTVTKDCPVQVLRFELSNPNQEVTTPADVATRLNGNVWFDDFRVRSLD